MRELRTARADQHRPQLDLQDGDTIDVFMEQVGGGTRWYHSSMQTREQSL